MKKNYIEILESIKDKNEKMEYFREHMNKIVKAVVMEFTAPEYHRVVVENDNFGKRRKHMDFTEGKKKAGLNPAQIVFLNYELAVSGNDLYIGHDDQIHEFGK